MRSGKHRSLRAWQQAMILAREGHWLAGRLPRTEQFALASQLRRSVISVPCNIAEGYGRMHAGDYLHHVSMARGSVLEVETQVELAIDFGYVREVDVLTLLERSDHVSRLLTRLGLSIRQGRAVPFAGRSPQSAARTTARRASAP